ncbi:MAG TPA: multidrug effflux MFS transporter [Alphaproteobacteria bacterium]|nr:multidrug effflux MFS transporter [Alphaproteobacteria bacterium]
MAARLPSADRERVSSDIGLPEFVALMAGLMALTALSIDVMLPALPAIADAFSIGNANQRQLVVTAYLLGFALGQPFCGPLSDRFGRKPVVVAGLCVYAAGSLGAVLAPDFSVLLLSRAVQGLGSASPRIMAIAIVRDRFAGRAMARVMSFVMMVFIIVPILAPALGEGILALGPWRWIFAFLAAAGLFALIWSLLRLPETRHGEDRMPLSLGAVGLALRTVIGNRCSIGYTVALGFMFGNLMSYIGSAQQVFVDTYDLGSLFPLAFGSIACFMALSSLINSRLVLRLGMRRISHAALLAYIAVCAAMGIAGYPEHPPLLVLCGFLAATFFFFGLTVPNFNALAMEPLGHVAGTASSVLGSYTTAAGAFFGWLIGQAFDGTVRPLEIGLSFLAVMALIAVLVTERGRLFVQGHANPPRAGSVEARGEADPKAK